MLNNWWNTILANPGRTLGIVAAVILAAIQTLVGKGVLTPDFQQNVENVGAIIGILITAFFPTWAPVKAMAARHK
jgi:hypothetical protein